MTREFDALMKRCPPQEHQVGSRRGHLERRRRTRHRLRRPGRPRDRRGSRRGDGTHRRRRNLRRAGAGGGSIAAGNFGVAGGTLIISTAGGSRRRRPGRDRRRYMASTCIAAEAIKLDLVTRMIAADTQDQDEMMRRVVESLQDRLNDVTGRVGLLLKRITTLKIRPEDNESRKRRAQSRIGAPHPRQSRRRERENDDRSHHRPHAEGPAVAREDITRNLDNAAASTTSTPPSAPLSDDDPGRATAGGCTAASNLR